MQNNPIGHEDNISTLCRLIFVPIFGILCTKEGARSLISNMEKGRLKTKELGHVCGLERRSAGSYIQFHNVTRMTAGVPRQA
jgi:hypothetical protein